MVLRAGVIIPFQYGGIKKLLMVGSPEENRDLKLFDFTNVVRAAFNIYNFEFRNKKIDFLIPEDLLISYLEQCNDLTNFVIQIDQVPTGHNLQPHCDTCHCAVIHDMFAHNSMFNYEMAPSKDLMCSTAKRDKAGPTGRFFHIKSHNDSDGSHKSSKPRKLSHDGDNDSYGRSSPKIRVRLLEHKNTIAPPPSHHSHATLTNQHSHTPQPPQHSHVHSHTTQHPPPQPSPLLQPPHHSHNTASKIPMETTSPNDVKSLHTNPMLIDDSDSNDSLSDRMQEDAMAKSTYTHSPAPNEYFVPRQTLQITHQQVQQTYEEPSQHYEQQYNQPQYSDLYLQSEENAMHRQRKERMSKRQKELYVEFLEQNPLVNKHRRNDPLLDTFWIRLTNVLNSCPNGAAKSVAEWKQAFDNWRYRIFLYARHNTKLNSDDGLDAKALKPLTRTDKRAYNLWIRNPDTAPANTEKLPNDLLCLED